MNVKLSKTVLRKLVAARRRLVELVNNSTIRQLYPDSDLEKALKLDELFEKIRKKEPLAYVRYGDGEYLLMMPSGKHIKTQDRWIIPAEISNLGKTLKKTLTVWDKNFFYAIPLRPTTVCNSRMIKWFLLNIKQERKYITDVLDSFVYHNYESFFRLVKTINESSILFANMHADIKSFPLKVKEFYRIADDCVLFYEQEENRFIREVQEIAAKYSNTLFIICAGPLGKIIAYEGWKVNPTNRYIDAGSAFDEFLFGKKTRPYQDPNSFYSAIK